MNVGDCVRLTKELPVRKWPHGAVAFTIHNGAQGNIRSILRKDENLVGVYFTDYRVEIAVSTRDLELVK